jgi:hypothetical protein
MLPPTSATGAGKRLRAARERLRLSTREVADLSREIALKKNAPDYFISRTGYVMSKRENSNSISTDLKA